MTYVVTSNCVDCRDTSCVAVCPVTCFKGGENFLVIDPTECIDCGVCVPECPVRAIYSEADVPKDEHDYIALNADLALRWRAITEQQAPVGSEAKSGSPLEKLRLIVR